MTTLCTYFDSSFLPRGLALHESLVRHWGDFTLLVLCLDDETERVLRVLDLPSVQTISLAQLERSDPGLATARASRSRLGYYMTCTPVLLRHALRQADAAIYLDADLFFFSSPQPALQEFSNGSIYVHQHRADHPDWDQGGGRFNVGLVGVRNDVQGRACVDLWRERCLEWCEFARADGRYGDQTYLDEWPHLFDGLIVTACRGIGAGPWNLGDLRYTRRVDGTICVDGVPLVFYHFTRLEQVGPGIVRTSVHSYVKVIDPIVRRFVYRPYLRELQRQAERMRGIGVSIESPFGRVRHDHDAAPAPNRAWRRAWSLARGLHSGAIMVSWGQFAL